MSNQNLDALGFEPRFLEHMDGRTVAARMLRQRLAEIHADLGGEPSLSYAQKSLARQALWIESWLETQQHASTLGSTPDVGRMTQAVNTLLGLWRTLGLERRAAPVRFGRSGGIV